MEPCTKLIPLQVFPLTTFDKVRANRQGSEDCHLVFHLTTIGSVTNGQIGVEFQTTPGLEGWEMHLGVQRTSSTREHGGIDTVVESTTQVWGDV